MPCGLAGASAPILVHSIGPALPVNANSVRLTCTSQPTESSTAKAKIRTLRKFAVVQELFYPAAVLAHAYIKFPGDVTVREILTQLKSFHTLFDEVSTRNLMPMLYLCTHNDLEEE